MPDKRGLVVDGSLHLSKPFLAKLLLSGMLTAMGIVERFGHEKIEMALAAFVVIPAVGFIFTYLKHGASDKVLRQAAITLAALFVWAMVGSLFLALAFYLILDSATQPQSITKEDAFRWLKGVETEESPDQLRNLVARHQLFQCLPKTMSEELLDECRLCQLTAGEHMIKQGVFNSDLYLIARGYLEVVVDGHHLATVGEGDIVGEISASGLSMPVADVIAESEVLAFAFPAKAIDCMTERCPEFGEKMRAIGICRQRSNEEEARLMKQFE